MYLIMRIDKVIYRSASNSLIKYDEKHIDILRETINIFVSDGLVNKFNVV